MVRDDQASSRPKGRIFWLGAHKLLVNTELPRLRALGYEVFYPPYLSHILDQSAASVWDRKQPTTLPPEIYDKLSRHNFFYDSINPVIAEILNEYFDAVVVTIVARWAAELLRVFNGTIVFRAYGQTHLLSDEFEDAGVRPLIEGRTNFHCCPHAQETLEGEADWLRQRSTVIPYCLTDEVYDVRGSWHSSSERNDQILVTAPNILGNPFHRAHYDFLKEYFYQKHFRYCGVQLVDIDDDQVVGVLGRHTQLSMFANAAGYLYTYRDSRVCYLPPVEMIVMGGPVAYFSGSLLARYIGKGGPGEATSVMDAHRITARLRANDRVFIEEVQASQAHVADLYDPARVWPVFDREMQRMLGMYPAGALSRPASREDRLRQLVRAVIDAADPLLLAQEGAAIASSLATSILHRPPADTEVQYLRSVLQEEGTVAALKEVIALNSGSRELLERLVEHPAPPQAGVADLYRDFAPPGSFIGIGRWSFNAGGNKCIRVVDRGEIGFVIFGPYTALPVGGFRIDLRARIAHSHVVAGVVDVCVAGDVRASRQISSSSSLFETFIVEFEVTDPEQRFEFRVQSNGSVDMEIESLVLIRTRS